MNNNNQPVYLNTWVIVVAFFLCWPVGVVLLILRSNANKKNMFDRHTTAKICYIVGGFLILAGLGSFSNSLFAGLFYTGGGAALIYFAKKNREKVDRYKAYINLIVNQNVTSLDSISRKLNIDYSVVISDMRTLISKGIFRNAVIDESRREIILSEIPNGGMNQNDVFGGMADAISGVANQVGVMMGSPSNPNLEAYSGNVSIDPRASMIAVKCPGCGATRRAIKGTGVECEYCGSIFNA